jgi:ATP-binding cassette, subfamily B, bacterial
MKILFQYLKRYRTWVLASFGLAAINQSFSLMDPVIMGKLFDYVKANSKLDLKQISAFFGNLKRNITGSDTQLDYVNNIIANNNSSNPQGISDAEFLSHVLLLTAGMIGVAMISRVAKAFQDYTVNTVIQRFGADVYTDGLKHSLQLPYQRFEDQRSGETLAILEKVKVDCEKLIMNFINVLFAVIVSVVFVIVYSLNHFPPIVFIYLIGSLVLSFLMSRLSRRYKTIQKSIVQETTALAGSTTESLRNIELIRSLGLTNQEIGRLKNATQKILQLELRKVKSLRALTFIQGTVVNLMRQIIVFCLCYAVFKDYLSQGEMLTMQFFSFFIFGPLQELGNIILNYREAETSLENYNKLMNMPIEPKPANPVVVDEIKELKFDAVTFQHLTAKTKALDEISFTVNKGETIAFVGPSGSGKTTLVKLLVGLYTPHSGNISYNGYAYNKIDFDMFRHQIGFVTQETQLFSGTIKENLQFVQPTATDQEILSALSKASCDNLLDRSEHGIDSVIGEGGIKVSGGEKQRLSIARAILRNPKLLVFDEATSALDSLTEEEITSTIKKISSDKTLMTILIAHRLSTIMHADKIFVLERGKIVETGSHEDLVAEKGLYYAMWRQQIGERKNEK